MESFNQMTRNLAQARDAAQRSQGLVESQRAYLETVLARLAERVGMERTNLYRKLRALGIDPKKALEE